MRWPYIMYHVSCISAYSVDNWLCSWTCLRVFIGSRSILTFSNMYRLNTRAGVLPRSASSHFHISLFLVFFYISLPASVNDLQQLWTTISLEWTAHFTSQTPLFRFKEEKRFETMQDLWISFTRGHKQVSKVIERWLRRLGLCSPGWSWWWPSWPQQVVLSWNVENWK